MLFVSPSAKIPLWRFSDWGAFVAGAPYNCPIVAVEMGGVPLDEFVHPPRAIYILGAGDVTRHARSFSEGDVHEVTVLLFALFQYIFLSRG
jgi:hypothetical protein